MTGVAAAPWQYRRDLLRQPRRLAANHWASLKLFGRSLCELDLAQVCARRNDGASCLPIRNHAPMINLNGLSAFPITPADRSGRVDAGSLQAVVAPLLAAGVDSIGLLGSTGTYAYFSREERRRAIQSTVAQAAGRLPILVGIGALRTDEAVKLAQDARIEGAAAGLLAPVSYTALTDDEVFEHFATVARESG